MVTASALRLLTEPLPLPESIPEILALFAVLVASLAIHEFGHAWTARALGDDTAARQGRVTLNPLPHLDLVFSVLLPLGLLLSGTGFLLGAGKPVPVDPTRFRRPAFDFMVVSVAGPFTNVVLALALTGLYHVLLDRGIVVVDTPASWMIFRAIELNVVLAVFNMLPVPPLDGHRVPALFMPRRVREWFYRAHWLGLIVLALILFGPGQEFLYRNALQPVAEAYDNLMPDDLRPLFTRPG